MMVSSAPKTSDKPKPSFSVTEDDLPAIKDWTVGKKYHVKAHVEMRSHSKGNSYGYDGEGSKKKHEAHLIVHSVEPADEEK